VAEREGSPPRFRPLQRASPPQRIVVLVLGPLLWLLALVVVGLVVEQSRAVEIGLLAVLVSLPLSLAVSVLAWGLRLREERRAESP
jgi:hypothetical protein